MLKAKEGHNMEHFKDRFIQALERAGMTRAELSRKTGISESILSYYASGKATPRKGKLMLICNALNTSPGWLLFGEEAVSFATEDMLIEVYRNLDNDRQKALLNYAKYLEIMDK